MKLNDLLVESTLSLMTKALIDRYGVVYGDDGSVKWYNKDYKLHRLDGPAVIEEDGTKKWYINGERHRIGGPAVESAEGFKTWFVRDKIHRLDGPAVIYADGRTSWIINNREYHSNRTFQKAAKLTDKQMAELVWKYGSVGKKDNQLHR